VHKETSNNCFSRDVKRSSKIRTLNKTFEFGFVFRPFNIRLLTVFYWMPLFIFDHNCVDRNIRIWSEGGATVVSAPVVAMGRFCWPRSGAVGGVHATWVTTIREMQVGTCGTVKPWDHATRCQCLCGLTYTLDGGGRSSPGGHSGWHKNCIFSRPSLRGYSHLLESFDPWKEPVCGIVCGWRRCRHIHWRMASHSHAVWLTQTVFSV